MKKFLDVMKIIFLKLHLWLPVAYSLLFLIIGAITNSLEGSAAFYFGGLSACLAVSLVLEFLTIGRQETSNGYRNVSAQPPRVRYSPRDEEAPEKIQEEQNRYAKSMTMGAPTSDVDYTRYDRPMSAPPSGNGADDILVHNNDELTGKKAHDALYSDFSSASSSVQSFSAYVQPENSLTNGPKMEDYEKSALPPEKPHVYRTHKNPNWLICEYSDRIEKWYVDPQTGDKSIISTEYKTKQ